MSSKVKFFQVAVLLSGIVTIVAPKFMGCSRMASQLHYLVAKRVEAFRYKLYHDLDRRDECRTLQCAVEATNYYSPDVPQCPNGTWEYVYSESNLVNQ